MRLCVCFSVSMGVFVCVCAVVDLWVRACVCVVMNVIVCLWCVFMGQGGGLGVRPCSTI